MSRTRWITGLAALPFLLVPIFVGGMAFYGLVAVAAVLALAEYFRIVFGATGGALRGPFPITAYIAAPVILGAAHAGSSPLILAGLAANLLAVTLVSLVRFRPDGSALRPVFTQVLGIVYVVLPLAMLTLLRGAANGAFWILLTLAVVFVGDTSAYHVGSRFGRHKLCPSVSPGKTVEGAAGGLMGNLAAGSLVKLLFLPALPWAGSLIFFAAAGIAGQIGDLFESQLKRWGGVKDSGTLLPGHGGILDRIDALLFAAPVAYLFQSLAG
jgi:phosphatidate cytidylyltransferase